MQNTKEEKDTERKNIKEAKMSKVQLTVQNWSLPSKSNPWMEQFPPTMASWSWKEPSLPIVIALAPSWV